MLKKNEYEIKNIKIIIFKFIIVIFFQSFIFLYYLSRLLYGIDIKSKAFLIKDNANRLESLQIEYKIFNETIRQRYIYLQQFFCQNPYLFNNSYIEGIIKSTKVNFSDIIFDMFVYKTDDYISEQISINGMWESNETEAFFLSLLFYENKKNKNKEEYYRG